MVGKNLSTLQLPTEQIKHLFSPVESKKRKKQEGRREKKSE